MSAYKLVKKQTAEDKSIVYINDIAVGGNEIIVMAGPCAVESRQQLTNIAQQVKNAGAKVLRGGAFKPRTSPYSFQGLEDEGLQYLLEAKEASGLPIVTEVMDTKDVQLVASYADILQVGSRNMQNFALLQEVGRTNKTILLKRGMSATIQEWLMAAEYIMNEGNENIIFCERGIRTFENYTRNTLDISAIPAIKELSHLPIIVDPSHATGKWQMVAPLAKAAIAAGADGLIIEVHDNPSEALCDGEQSLTPDNFELLMNELDQVAKAVGRSLKNYCH